MKNTERKLLRNDFVSNDYLSFCGNMFSFVLIGTTIFSPSVGQAQSMALEPQNRLLAGYTFNDGNQGIGIGFDSRLTQLIYINIGAFTSFSDREYEIDEEDASSWISLNNGIYAAPGIRFPHRYKSDKNALNWDLLFRTGFACVSSNNAFEENWFLVEPASFIGIDFLLKKYNYGLSLSGKGFRYRVDISSIQQTLYVTRPQFTGSFFYQW
jgi:hypothetical protein